MGWTGNPKEGTRGIKMRIINDIAREEQRISKLKSVDFKRELLDTIFPLLHTLAAECQGEFRDIGEVLAELVDDDVDDLFDEDFVSALVKTLETGRDLLDECKPDQEILQRPTSDLARRMDQYYNAVNKLSALLKEYLLELASAEEDLDDEDDLEDDSEDEDSGESEELTEDTEEAEKPNEE
jgi:hypothetical protein